MKIIEITKRELREIYSKNTSIDAAEIVGVSLRTFYKMLTEAGIPLEKARKGKRKENTVYIIKD